MIGIIPGNTRTFEVYGDFTEQHPIEGKLYYNPKDGRVFYYSTTIKRSNPETGFFPIWDGKDIYISNFSNDKYFEKDVTKVDVNTMSTAIDKDVADQILYMHRRSENDEILKPQLSDGDNMFTQCIKGVIAAKELTMVDLVDMSVPKLSEKIIENYYSALTKIAFMRLDKWNIWINIILHVTFSIEVFKDDKRLLLYSYPDEKFDVFGVDESIKFDDIIFSDDDSLKKIIKILMRAMNINKNSLRSEDVDDYTINNMMTTINGSKSLSAQLFSRFIRMAELSYIVHIYDNGKQIFEYKES